MTFDKFLKKTPLTTDDLCGEWKQKGLVPERISTVQAGSIAAQKLSWMRVRVKRALRAKEIIVPMDADCTFKRGKVSFAKIAETMEIRSKNVLIYTIISGNNQLKILNGGEEETTDIKNQVEDKSISHEIPGYWINRALQDKIIAESCEEGVKYWEEKRRAR